MVERSEGIWVAGPGGARVEAQGKGRVEASERARVEVPELLVCLMYNVS